MLCIDNPYTDVHFNLAAEEYLLKNFSNDVFMLWQNDPSVVIGKHQNVETEVDLSFIRDNHIKVARRYSGGGAVFHDLGNLNLTFIESNNLPDFDKYIKQIQQVLSIIGIHTQADERRALFIDGLKISGSAQYIRKNKVLFHATLLFSSNLTHLVSTLNSQYPDQKDDMQSQPWRYVKSVKSPVTNINEHLLCPLSITDFKRIIIQYFTDNNTDNHIYTFSKEDIAAIVQLKQEKYATTDWNFLANFLK